MNPKTLAVAGWAIRIIVYIMLVSSAAAAFLLSDRLWQAARSGELPLWGPLVPVLTFTAFVVVYSVDRYLLVRRRRATAVRALFQVAFAAVFLTLLWPQQAAEFRRATAQEELASGPFERRLLAHQDADVRAAACELAGLKAQAQLRTQIAQLAQDDGSRLVREWCQKALDRLDASSAGTPSP